MHLLTIVYFYFVAVGCLCYSIDIPILPVSLSHAKFPSSFCPIFIVLYDVWFMDYLWFIFGLSLTSLLFPPGFSFFRYEYIQNKFIYKIIYFKFIHFYRDLYNIYNLNEIKFHK